MKQKIQILCKYLKKKVEQPGLFEASNMCPLCLVGLVSLYLNVSDKQTPLWILSIVFIVLCMSKMSDGISCSTDYKLIKFEIYKKQKS